MENNTQFSCTNCGMQASGKYCSSCGQQYLVRRIKWSTLFSELNQRILGLDNKFARTVKDLTISPGKVAKAFIQGNRVRYIGPVGYFFVLMTIYVLIISLLGIDMFEYTKETNAFFETEESKRVDASKFQQILMANMKLVSFTLIPFFALAAFLVFYKKGYNFLETCVLIFYGHAHPLILVVINVVIYKFIGFTDNTYVFPISIIYFGYFCMNFYEGSKVKLFIKGVASYILGFFLFVFLIVAIILIVALIEPEILKTVFPRKS